MTAAALTVTVEDGPVKALLAGLIGRIARMAPVLDTIGFTVSQRIASTFRDQTDPWGTRWAPHSPVTLALRRRRRSAGGEKILRDTGVLANSITHLVTGNAVEIGADPSAVSYAATQQLGRASNRVFGKAPGPIPARPFLPIRSGGADLPDEWENEILDVIGAYLDEVAR